MIERFGVKLPEKADLPARPKGIVYHWTGGGPTANSVDLAAYHIVVEHDGTVKLGKHLVASNMRAVSEKVPYAAHTGGFNSYRIGIACAGMKDYINPKHTGKHHLTVEQVHRMCALGAYFCDEFGLDPMDPANVCTHLEVWTIHGVKGKQNHYKTDIEWLAFQPDLKKSEVGYYLRKLTKSYTPEAVLDKTKAPAPKLSVPKPFFLRRLRLPF